MDALKSEEYERINRAMVAMDGRLDLLDNRLEVLSQTVRSHRAKIGLLDRREKAEEESEKDIKDKPLYL